MEPIKLTQYSHGAGCGCKISPAVLTKILERSKQYPTSPNLLVGNDTRDDAAVYAIDDENVIISTTDFFMPIVDDPFDFGGIASVNAISDIYAMGGKPLMAIAILGWPLDKLAPEIAGEVLNGARAACAKAGISVAGGHSIDAPEPIFGLAVTGIAKRKNIKLNATGLSGCELFLTKPIGIGMLTTATKKGLLKEEDLTTARDLMLTLNDAGADFSQMDCVSCMTDVTGFGLLGHLIEICEGSKLSAEIEFSKVPTIKGIEFYLDKKTFPGGTSRNFESYGYKANTLTQQQKAVLCDPQTSGGLLVAVNPKDNSEFLTYINKKGWNLTSFGKLTEKNEHVVRVVN